MPIEEIEGKCAAALFPELADRYYQDNLEVITSGIPWIGIIEPMTMATGEHLRVRADKVPLRDEQGTIIGILLFIVEITERKHAEDALVLASKKLNLLSSITWHEILNQLTALKGYIELSREEQRAETCRKLSPLKRRLLIRSKGRSTSPVSTRISR